MKKSFPHLKIVTLKNCFGFRASNFVLPSLCDDIRSFGSRLEPR